MRQPPADTMLVISDRNLPRLTSRIALDPSQGERAGRYRIYTADAIYAAIARTRSGDDRDLTFRRSLAPHYAVSVNRWTPAPGMNGVGSPRTHAPWPSR